MILPLPHDFNHSYIDRFQLGPRRELTLFLQAPIQPPGRVEGRLQHYVFGIHFSAIDNFAEVGQYCEPEFDLALIASLAYTPEEESRNDRLVFTIRWEVPGVPDLVMRCRNMALRQDIP